MIFSFHLDFSSGGRRAVFPFIFEGRPLPGISCAISSRSAGNMLYSEGAAVAEREAFYESLGLSPRRVYALTQVHSRKVLVVDLQSPNMGPEGDGLISRESRVSLSVTVADCLPVYLYDTGSGGFGLLHSGWKGTGIVLEALGLMSRFWQTRPAGVAAVLGPCIQSCCYAVDQERALAFEAEFGPHGAGDEGGFPLGPVTGRPAAERFPGAEYSLNLQAANARLLAGAGVRNIAVCTDCTFTDERLGSFRREGAAYTRMAAVVGRF